MAGGSAESKARLLGLREDFVVDLDVIDSEAAVSSLRERVAYERREFPSSMTDPNRRPAAAHGQLGIVESGLKHQVLQSFVEIGVG
jgi:hypothetical protein